MIYANVYVIFLIEYAELRKTEVSNLHQEDRILVLRKNRIYCLKRRSYQSSL